MAIIPDKPTEISHYAGLLMLEIDAEYICATSVPPEPLSVSTTAALAVNLVKDLDTILNGIEHLGLIIPGALYDQTEILQPGFPLINTLATLYQKSSTDCIDFKPQLIILGADQSGFPITAINPLRRPGSGPLLLLPFCFIGKSKDIVNLAITMENILLQSGRVSQETCDSVHLAFNLKVLNLSFATIKDLCALLKVHLESAGLLQLWNLLEHCWTERTFVLSVSLDDKNRFFADKNNIHTIFYTFDDWAQFGPGKHLSEVNLGTGYRNWMRTQRQYTLALGMYGLHVRLVLANPELEVNLMSIEDDKLVVKMLQETPCLSGDFLVESIFQKDTEDLEKKLLITNQADIELGTLAYTVATTDARGMLLRLENHYPLCPRGLNIVIDRLIQRCNEQHAERLVLHPGRLVYSEGGRNLLSANSHDLLT